MSSPRALLARPRFVCRTCTRRFQAQSQSRRSFASTSSAEPDIYDVVCVGGGPAGLSLLSALRMFPVTRRRNAWANNLKVLIPSLPDSALP